MQPRSSARTGWKATIIGSVVALTVGLLAGPVAAQTDLAQPVIDGGAPALEPVADGLTAPNWGTAAPGVDGRLFVTDQGGIVWNVDLDTGCHLGVPRRVGPSRRSRCLRARDL